MTFVAGGALKPVGGHILSHASATRIFLRKGEKQRRRSLPKTLVVDFMNQFPMILPVYITN
ncbi:hypothetical protein M404DRAFT_1001413 [Pisolithus tinctorius Marx 270]|uniref:Rad51-like C-terminal domain-containing protein n=1 Tax=Pisolithus tinctorius Marx 270 TaxID=870435 RepID=A0A0C3NRJ9_PISTI|nr:hypothetical protein M404DRAFT_1001413 [Pisolithus tinctorius Marx 270]